MEYKGYIGNVIFDYDAMIFHGEVINTRDVITFQGISVTELEKEFKNSINDYIEWCNDEGVSPEKPYSGKFNVRISPDLHRKIAQAAHKKMFH
jgi:predicted HicB family RNase H-like nuclease